MTRLVSIGTKLEQLRGMLGTTDLTDWEQSFVTNVAAQYARTRSAGALTDKQTEIVERIWDKHFA